MPNYLSPGVYVEEVEAGSRPSRASAPPSPHSSASPRTGPRTRRRWSRTGASSSQTFGDFMRGLVPGPRRVRLLPQRRRRGLRRPHRRRRRDARRATAELHERQGRRHAAPTASSALEAGPGGNEITVEVVPTPRAGRGHVQADGQRSGGKARSRRSTTCRPSKGKTQRRHDRQGAVEAHPARGGRQRRRARARPGDAARHPARGGDERQPVRVTPDDYVGDSRRPHRLRRPRGGRRGHDARRARPDGRLPAGHHRPRGRPGRAAGDDRPLRADGRPRRDPRRAARPERPAGQGVAGRQGRLRLASTRRSTGRGSRSSTRCPGQATFVPPSGHMAGIWARNDDTRGVHKAPANEVVRGALSLELQHHQGRARPAQPDRRSTASARSPAAASASGAPARCRAIPAWRYLNVRRLFNYVEESILEGTQWVVFEPNDLDLWERVKRTINAFLLRRLARRRALRGDAAARRSSSSATRRTTRPRCVDAGQLIVEIGIAPVKPAEFVVFRIAQFSGGAAVEE